MRNADRCEASGDWTGEVALSGSTAFTAAGGSAQYRFVLSCSSAVDSASAEWLVQVEPAADAGEQDDGGGMPLSVIWLAMLWLSHACLRKHRLRH